MKYEFIHSEQYNHSIVKLAKVMQVSRSGFYAWLTRYPSETEQKRNKNKNRITEIYIDSYGIYGAPKITAVLNAKNVDIAERTVSIYMHQMGLKSIVVKRFKRQRSPKRQLPYDNVLDQNFSTDRPNTAWVTDITYIWTKKHKWCYLASVMDLFNRSIVGYSVSRSMTVELAKDALMKALASRNKEDDLIHHSDRGVQYTSAEYIGTLAEHGIQASLSGAGNCYDNACIEAFHSILKKELIYRKSYENVEEVEKDLFKYIEGFYNSRRVHSSLGYLSPNEYERRYYASLEE